MLFSFIGLGVPEIIVLALCCGVVVIVPVVLILVLGLGGSGNAEKKRAADKMAADTNDDYDRGAGKIDKDTRFEKNQPGKESGKATDDEPDKDSGKADDIAGGGGDD